MRGVAGHEDAAACDGEPGGPPAHLARDHLPRARVDPRHGRGVRDARPQAPGAEHEHRRGVREPRAEPWRSARLHAQHALQVRVRDPRRPGADRDRPDPVGDVVPLAFLVTRAVVAQQDGRRVLRDPRDDPQPARTGGDPRRRQRRGDPPHDVAAARVQAEHPVRHGLGDPDDPAVGRHVGGAAPDVGLLATRVAGAWVEPRDARLVDAEHPDGAAGDGDVAGTETDVAQGLADLRAVRRGGGCGQRRHGGGAWARRIAAEPERRGHAGAHQDRRGEDQRPARPRARARGDHRGRVRGRRDGGDRLATGRRGAERDRPLGRRAPALRPPRRAPRGRGRPRTGSGPRGPWPWRAPRPRRARPAAPAGPPTAAAAGRRGAPTASRGPPSRSNGTCPVSAKCSTPPSA